MTPIHKLIDDAMKCTRCGTPASKGCRCVELSQMADRMFADLMSGPQRCFYIEEMIETVESILERYKTEYEAHKADNAAGGK